MVRGIDAASAQFLANLERIHDRQAKAQRAISSGLRVSKPSDAPENVMDILQLRSSVEMTKAIGSNLERATAELNIADSAVTVAINLVERARVLATHGASQTASNRPGLAVEVNQILDQMVHLTYTMSEGRYVFSGDLDQEVLYKTDSTAPGGFVRLAQAENTRKLQDVNGTQFSISKSAHDIFDARNPDDSFAEENVFNAVWKLADALTRNSVEDVEAAAALLGKAVDHLGRQTTFFGNSQKRLTDAVDLNTSVLNARRGELGRLQDTDIAEALVELNLVGVHQQAALGAQAQMNRKSLFDYLG